MKDLTKLKDGDLNSWITLDKAHNNPFCLIFFKILMITVKFIRGIDKDPINQDLLAW